MPVCAKWLFNTSSERDYVREAISNVIEKRHGFPAGCGYIDAWTEQEREEITASLYRVDASIARLQRMPWRGIIEALVEFYREQGEKI